MERQLELVGAALVLLALMHAVFPRYFKWAEELPRLSLVNAEMMRVHTLFIAVVVGLMGVLCVTSAAELVGTPLGRRVCAGIAAFWSLRLAVQFVGYSPELWRGKRFETVVHVVFTGLWAWISGVFWWVGTA